MDLFSDPSVPGALNSAFPMLDFASFAAPAAGEGATEPMSLFDGEQENDTTFRSFDASAMHPSNGMRITMSDDDGTELGASAALLLPSEALHSAHSELFSRGLEGKSPAMRLQSVGSDCPPSYSPAELASYFVPEGKELGTVKGGRERSTPDAPVLPADGACLRATHVRTMLEVDALSEAMRGICGSLKHVVSAIPQTATLLCTGVDPLSGTPIDYSVQIYKQDGASDRVVEVLPGARGDRAAFAWLFSSISALMQQEAITSTPVVRSSSAPSTGPMDSLSAPAPLASRGATIGAVSAMEPRDETALPKADVADVSVPGLDGLVLLVDRVQDEHQDATVPDCMASIATIAARLSSMTPEDRAECFSRMDEAKLTDVVVSVIAKAAQSSSSLDDSTVVPALFALGRLFENSCPALSKNAKDTLTALDRLVLCAQSALHEAAGAAAPADIATTADVTHWGLEEVPTRLVSSGDGPAAMSDEYMVRSGSILRLRASASALLAAARSGDVAPGVTWASFLRAEASHMTKALSDASRSSGDVELQRIVDTLVSTTAAA
jgi:hypothetical protein